MRITVSILGVAGLMLTVVSLFLPWLTRDFFDTTVEHRLTDFEMYLGLSSSHLARFAYSTALYMMAVGVAVPVYSLLGGFVTLAAASTFTLGGALGDEENCSFGLHEALQMDVSPGIGLYFGFTAALVMLIAVVHPWEVAVGTGGPRPKFRTWHLSRGGTADEKS